VIAHLLAAGLLEHRAGAGSMVAKGPEASQAEKTKLLEGQLGELAVEEKRLAIELVDMQEAIEKHWKRLSGVSAKKVGRGSETHGDSHRRIDETISEKGCIQRGKPGAARGAVHVLVGLRRRARRRFLTRRSCWTTDVQRVQLIL